MREPATTWTVAVGADSHRSGAACRCRRGGRDTANASARSQTFVERKCRLSRDVPGRCARCRRDGGRPERRRQQGLRAWRDLKGSGMRVGMKLLAVNVNGPRGGEVAPAEQFTPTELDPFMAIAQTAPGDRMRTLGGRLNDIVVQQLPPPRALSLRRAPKSPSLWPGLPHARLRVVVTKSTERLPAILQESLLELVESTPIAEFTEVVGRRPRR